MSDGSLLRASRLVLLGLLATSASALTLPPALTQLRQSAMRSLLRDVAPVPSPFALASNFDTRAFNPPDMRESRVTLTFPGNSEQIVNELVSSALSGSSDVFKSRFYGARHPLQPFSIFATPQACIHFHRKGNAL